MEHHLRLTLERPTCVAVHGVHLKALPRGQAKQHCHQRHVLPQAMRAAVVLPEPFADDGQRFATRQAEIDIFASPTSAGLDQFLPEAW